MKGYILKQNSGRSQEHHRFSWNDNWLFLMEGKLATLVDSSSEYVELKDYSLDNFFADFGKDRLSQYPREQALQHYERVKDPLRFFEDSVRYFEKIGKASELSYVLQNKRRKALRRQGLNSRIYDGRVHTLPKELSNYVGYYATVLGGKKSSNTVTATNIEFTYNNVKRLLVSSAERPTMLTSIIQQSTPLNEIIDNKIGEKCWIQGVWIQQSAEESFLLPSRLHTIGRFDFRNLDKKVYLEEEAFLRFADIPMLIGYGGRIQQIHDILVYGRLTNTENKELLEDVSEVYLETQVGVYHWKRPSLPS